MNHHACAFLTFGSGPRNCLGMRLAYLEAKMALIEVIKKYKILLAPETKVCYMLYRITCIYNFLLLPFICHNVLLYDNSACSYIIEVEVV